MVLYNFAWNYPNEGNADIKPLTIAFGEGITNIGYSRDGIYWNSCNTDAFTTRANYGCWNGVIWVSVGTGGNWVASSYDGINWTGQDNNILSEGYYVAWNGTVFLACGIAKSSTPNTTFAISTDGLSWTAVSSNIFYGGYSNWVGWTGNVWCATGSGNGNTTATSLSIYGNVWIEQNNTSIIMDASSIITDMSSSITSSTGNASFAIDNIWNKTSSQPTEWRTTGASYDVNGSPTNCIYSTIVGSSLNNISGEYLQISTTTAVIINYYILIFNISGNLYETPKSWYLLGANSASPTYWDIIDYRQITLTTPPSYGPNSYYAVPIALKNNTAYQYYQLLITSIFSSATSTYNTRIMEIDLFYANTPPMIEPRIKSFINPNGVYYPIRLKNCNLLTYADQTNTIISPPIFGLSYYNTDISYGNITYPITNSIFDGTTTIITTSTRTGPNIFYTTDYGKTCNNTSITAENIDMQIFGSAYNGNYFIICGNAISSSGNVLLYGKTENGINNWYSTINAKKIFTKIWGVASNSGYGYNVPNNSIYLDIGDKFNIITPKTYPRGGGADVQLSFDLNTFPVSF